MVIGEISIRDLSFDCIIGTLSNERINKQPIILNVSVWLDFLQVAQSENLQNSVDYAALANDVQKFICESKFLLEETLVVKTAEYILEHYKNSKAVEVSVRKPQAILNAAYAESKVKINRYDLNER